MRTSFSTVRSIPVLVYRGFTYKSFISVNRRLFTGGAAAPAARAAGHVDEPPPREFGPPPQAGLALRSATAPLLSI